MEFKGSGNNDDMRKYLVEWKKLAIASYPETEEEEMDLTSDLPQDLSLESIFSWAKGILSDRGNNAPVAGIGGDYLVMHRRHVNFGFLEGNDFSQVRLTQLDGRRSIVLWWAGTWTTGRFIQLRLSEKKGQIRIDFQGRTGTFQESTFLGWWMSKATSKMARGNGWTYSPAAA